MAQPAHKIRTGLLSVTIWKNKGEKGAVWFSVGVSRSYQKGEEWQESSSFGFDDLLTVAKMLDQAHTWIARQNTAEAKARKARQEAETGDQ